jgi:hypothetical protein
MDLPLVDDKKKKKKSLTKLVYWTKLHPKRDLFMPNKLLDKKYP